MTFLIVNMMNLHIPVIQATFLSIGGIRDWVGSTQRIKFPLLSSSGMPSRASPRATVPGIICHCKTCDGRKTWPLQEYRIHVAIQSKNLIQPTDNLNKPAPITDSARIRGTSVDLPSSAQLTTKTEQCTQKREKKREKNHATTRAIKKLDLASTELDRLLLSLSSPGPHTAASLQKAAAGLSRVRWNVDAARRSTESIDKAKLELRARLEYCDGLYHQLLTQVPTNERLEPAHYSVESCESSLYSTITHDILQLSREPLGS
jgi:hypothetical protein